MLGMEELDIDWTNSEGEQTNYVKLFRHELFALLEAQEKKWAELVFKLLVNIGVCRKEATPTTSEVIMALQKALSAQCIEEATKE